MDAPWGYAPTPILAADAESFEYLGPLTPAQYVALVWRVKEITVAFSVDWEVPGGDPDSGTSTITDGVMIRRDPDNEIVDSETRLAEINNPLAIENAVVFSNAQAVFSFALPVGPFGTALYKDENDALWLEPVFGSGNLATSDDDLFYLGWGETADFAVYDLTPFELEIPGGSPLQFPFAHIGSETIGSVTSATASIEITGWFPYATKGGDPAWDATTGGPLNGGPGG
jgi:hypothetical protein